MRDNEGKTTGVERKWRQAYKWSRLKMIVSHLRNVNLRQFMKKILSEEIYLKELLILCCHVIL